MPDEIIDVAVARKVHADACRRHKLVGWLVMKDMPDYPGKLIARLATDAPSVYVLVADTLAELHALLPPGLECSERQPADLAELVEIWFAA